MAVKNVQRNLSSELMNMFARSCSKNIFTEVTHLYFTFEIKLWIIY